MIYQLITIISPELSEEDLTKIPKKVADLIKNRGGKILKDEDLGRKKLATKIKKQEFGHFWRYELDISSGEAAQKFFQKDIKKVPGLMRLMIIKLKPVKIEEKVEKKIKKAVAPKPVKLGKPRVAVKSIKPKRIKPKSKIVTEMESEEDRMKTLDKKLDEILKE